MGYVIKHSTSNVNKARRKGNVAIGVDSSGYDKTSVSGFYAGVPPVEGKHNFVRTTSGGDPNFYCLDDTELINFANQLGGNVTTVASAKTYLLSQDGVMSTDVLPNNTVVDNLLFDFNFTLPTCYPGSGVIYYDLGGNNYHASASSNTTYVEYDSNLSVVNFKGGEVDGHGLFIQDLNYISGDSDQLEELTIDTLIKTTSGTSGNSVDQRIILSFDRSSVFRFSVGGDNGAAISNPGKLSFMSPQTGDKSATNCPDLRDDKWHRVAVTFKSGAGNGLRYYVDGELVETDTSTYSPIGSQGTSETPRYGVIGAGSEKTNDTPGSSTAPDSIFDGSMASIKYYNSQLSQTEILQNYYGGPIVTDGLVLAMDAGNLVSYESGSTVVYNMTGSTSGSLNNGVAYTDPYGGSFDFDGANDAIDIPGYNFEAGEVSISCWIYKDSNAQSTAEGIISKSSSSKREFHLRIEDSPLNGIYFWKSDNGSGAGNLFDTNVPITLNEWQHIVVTMNTTNVEFYLNGENVKSYSGTYTLFNSDGDIRIGGWSEGSGYYFNGKIPNIYVYNRSLTSDEVLQNYNAHKARFI